MVIGIKIVLMESNSFSFSGWTFLEKLSAILTLIFFIFIWYHIFKFTVFSYYKKLKNNLSFERKIKMRIERLKNIEQRLIDLENVLSLQRKERYKYISELVNNPRSEYDGDSKEEIEKKFLKRTFKSELEEFRTLKWIYERIEDYEYKISDEYRKN